MRRDKKNNSSPAKTPKLKHFREMPEIRPPTELPELGTKEAALKGCVDLIARMCGKPEHVVSYWLDLYFQTRLAYAVEEQQRRRDAQLINRIPQIFCTPKREEAEPAAPAPEAKAEGEAVAAPPPSDPPGDLTGFEPVTVNKGGAPRGNASDAPRYKREILARLLRMRKDGLTIAKIVNVSNGSIKEETVLDILDAKRVPIAVYRLLAAVLDKIEES